MRRTIVGLGIAAALTAAWARLALPDSLPWLVERASRGTCSTGEFGVRDVPSLAAPPIGATKPLSWPDALLLGTVATALGAGLASLAGATPRVRRALVAFAAAALAAATGSFALCRSPAVFWASTASAVVGVPLAAAASSALVSWLTLALWARGTHAATARKP